MTTITALPTAPSRSDTPATFISRADAWVAALATFVTQVNAVASEMNAIAAGTAMSIPYTFSTTTTDSDPGAGFLRLDNATQNAATTIRADLAGSDGLTWTSVLDTFDDSTSTIKGFIMLQKQSDGTKFLLFSVSALASPSGYKNITVANVASSSATPFANNDSIVLKFTRNGDKGETGATGAAGAAGVGVYQLHMREEQTSGTNGGGSSSGYNTRTLNTTVTNTIAGASLASDLITLPAGTYEFKASAPAVNSGHHRLDLYNHSDSTTIMRGLAVRFGTSTEMSRSTCEGRFTLAAQKDVKLRHYIETTQATNGLGSAVSEGGVNEIYSSIIIMKV